MIKLKLSLISLLLSLAFNVSLENPLNGEPNLKIGSFNVQTLGPTKMSRPEFVKTVTKVFAKYDILLIQEIRDSSLGLTVINTLVREVNALVKDRGIIYSFVISPRLGQGTYKEQYAYLYR